jgi:hypothetical protein
MPWEPFSRYRFLCVCPISPVGAPSITVTTCNGDHAGNHADHPAPDSGIDVGAHMNILGPRGGSTYKTNPEHHAGITATSSPFTWDGAFDTDGGLLAHIQGYRADGTGVFYEDGVETDWCGTWWSTWGN